MKRLLIVLALIATAGATMVKPMTVEELTSASSAIVEGQAVDSWTSWNAQHTRIYTYTRVKVARALKGNAAETVVVKEVGGSADGYTQHVAGLQPMSTGERALRFLRPSVADDGTMVSFGLMQGHFRVAKDPQRGATVVSNGVIGAEQLSGKTVKHYQGSQLTLSEMETRIRKAVAQ